MSKSILIVESDAGASRMMRAELERHAFTVEETTDGKGSIELIRRTQPDLVLLAVDLSAGQNGYILCGKLKKDDDLKTVPIIIVGNPDGFAQHRKLKTRADEYLEKPVDPQALIERVGGLIGLPEGAAGEELVEDEGLNLAEFGDEDTGAGDVPAEELAVVTEDATVQGDPELDMLDAAFDGISEPGDGAGSTDESGDELNVPDDEPLAAAGDDDAMQSLEGLGDGGEEEVVAGEETGGDDALTGLGEFDDEAGLETAAVEPEPEPEPEPVRPAFKPTSTSRTPIAPAKPAAPARPLASARPAVGGGSDADARALRSRVAELEAALTDAEGRATDAEGRAQELESELSAKSAELETSRSAGGKNDKEFFALREAANRKDKEILRLKNELNEKDNEIVELRDREMALEQKSSESSGEIARRDAQLKSLQTKVDQLTADKRKADQQLAAAREEARNATARLTTFETDLEAVTQERDELRGRADQTEAETAELRETLERTQGELNSAQEQLSAASAQSAEELESLRRRVAELEESAAAHEDRLAKLYGRVKADEKVREKTRKAIAIAMQLLDEQAQADEEANADDEAVA